VLREKIEYYTHLIPIKESSLAKATERFWILSAQLRQLNRIFTEYRVWKNVLQHTDSTPTTFIKQAHLIEAGCLLTDGASPEQQEMDDKQL
jgi:hypothetical protein